MKKTMKKSALLSSIAMLVVSAIVLTSATYAWFSSSKQVTVQNLQTSVKVSTGLLVSVDKGDNWSTGVSFENNTEAVRDDWGTGIPKVFDPVSTADGNTWISAIFEDGNLKKEDEAPIAGEDGKFVAVPFWVTGPAGAVVAAEITFNVMGNNSANCLKFALVPANDDGNAVVQGKYTEAVAAAPNNNNEFVGISSVGEVADKTEGSAYVSDGGTTINEIATMGTETEGIHFTLPEGTSTEQPMKFIAFLWLEGNDADCAMLKFSPTGETINFSMLLKIVKEAPVAAEPNA
ncbi:MAG: hypothetical protein E7536_03555 [Ruminococcaceae bacterium]|nr:hypothetical protein [Oscillospiraceae bacterium]